jgi:hypothetical protein
MDTNLFCDHLKEGLAQSVTLVDAEPFFPAVS